MPRLRRKPKQRIQTEFSELTIDLKWELIWGEPIFEDESELRGNLDSFKKAWEIHRETILHEYIKDKPGYRPFAWWLLDHKKERLIISHKLCPNPDKMRTESRYDFLDIAGQEPEPACLRRLGLMSDEEIEAYNSLQVAWRSKYPHIHRKHPELV